MIKVYELSYMQDNCGQISQVTFGYVRTLDEAKQAIVDNPSLSYAPATLSQDDMWMV